MKNKILQNNNVEVFRGMDVSEPQHRVVWRVRVFGENDKLIEMKSFLEKQDAEEYAMGFCDGT